MASTYLQDRVTAIKARILLYEDALLAFASTGIQSYNINTGQTVQTVTRANIGELERIVRGLLNDIVTIEARCTGSGSYTGRGL